MLVELRQLRAFVTVAEVGHFGQAADKLNVTQPGLSQRIQALERELGVQLFERNAREVRLTEAGNLLLGHARRLVELESEAVRELRDHRAGTMGRLRVAYQHAGDVSLVAAIIAEFRLRFPAVDFETTSGPSGTNLRLLVEHGTDAAFALMTSVRHAGIAAQVIRREEVILAMRSDHPLAHMQRIPVGKLRGEALSMPPHAVNPDLVSALTRWLVRRTGAPLNVASEDPTDLAVLTAAKSSRAAILVVRSYAMSNPVEGLVYRSISPAALVDLAVAYHEDDLSPALANFLRVVREVAPFDPGAAPEDGDLI